MSENKIYKPSYLGLIPTAAGLGIFFLFVGLQFLLIALTAPITESFFVFIIALIAIIAIILFFVYLSIKLTSYELRSDGLLIRRGVIAKKQILLLYTQIQDVTEYQTLWSRIVGLKALQIETMTSASTSAGILSNLTANDADELRHTLLQIVNNKSKKNQKNASNASVQYDSNKEENQNSSNPYPVHFVRMGIISAFVYAIIILIVYMFIVKLDLESSFNLILQGAIILFIPIGYFIRQISFKYWTGEKTVTIKNGLISTQKTSIEYEKIQDFIHSQGIIARIIGLASIKIETGSAVAIPQGYNSKQRPIFEISALKDEDAKMLIPFFMKKMGIQYTPQNIPLVQQIPLSQKKVIKKTLSGLIGLFIFIGIVLPMTYTTIYFMTLNTGITNIIFSKIIFWTIIVFAVLALWTLIYQKMYYDRYYYDWSRNTLTIRKGVIGKQQIYLPFGKIQNVFMDQDLFDRIFGLYDVHLSTVGRGSIRMCHIDGLNKENADKMLAVLLEQVKENI